jgi:hypothetical protein
VTGYTKSKKPRNHREPVAERAFSAGAFDSALITFVNVGPIRAVDQEYLELDNSVANSPHYAPMPTWQFDPDSLNYQTRYKWLDKLKLSVPILMIKVSCGGSLGTLTWILRRGPGCSDEEGACSGSVKASVVSYWLSSIAHKKDII